MRLDKFLTDGCVGTRSEVKKYIRAGRVTVNGLPAGRPELHIDETADLILVDGCEIASVGNVCLMLNKPAGVVSATQDHRDQTVIDLISLPYADRLFPVGRLDKDTEGLLLLTNDGALSHALLSPGKHVPKTYSAVITGREDEEIVRQFAHGIDIGEKKPTMPAQLVFLSCETEKEQEKCEVLITICEGKFHQIKRMFQAVGRKVLSLRRISMGPLKLDPALAPGEWRMLTEEEVKQLRGYTAPCIQQKKTEI